MNECAEALNMAREWLSDQYYAKVSHKGGAVMTQILEAVAVEWEEGSVSDEDGEDEPEDDGADTTVEATAKRLLKRQSTAKMHTVDDSASDHEEPTDKDHLNREDALTMEDIARIITTAREF